MRKLRSPVCPQSAQKVCIPNSYLFFQNYILVLIVDFTPFLISPKGKRFVSLGVLKK